jgi:hypothetical protein
MTSNKDARRLLDWHIPALAFFGMGMILGIAFVTAGPVVGIRALGAIATLSGILGLAVVLYTLRLEDPVSWMALTDRAAVAFETATQRWNALWVRRRTFDRYLQGAVWSGMN